MVKLIRPHFSLELGPLRNATRGIVYIYVNLSDLGSTVHAFLVTNDLFLHDLGRYRGRIEVELDSRII